MCGIFAYMGHQTISLTQVIKVLRILETEQETGEPSPVGGHGAGIAFLNQKHEFALFKVGKTKGSPVHHLKRQLSNTATRSQVILGHVRRASPEFQDTIQHAECTQPYQPHCRQNLNLISAHNGFLQNYQQLKIKLNVTHRFESEPIRLIDSEVIPHLYEELLAQTKDTTKAVHTLHEQIEGNNTAIIITAHKQEAYLHAIHKGKTRGLTVWISPKGEVLLCSREQPVQRTLHELLTESNYQGIITIHRTDTVNIQAHFRLRLPPQPQTKPHPYNQP